MVFGSFNLHDEFFAKHQLNYLGDIVRVLTYTGLRYNFYDVIVMALDENVLREQTEKARNRIDHDPSMQHPAPAELRNVGEESLPVAWRTGNACPKSKACSTSA